MFERFERNYGWYPSFKDILNMRKAEKQAWLGSIRRKNGGY